MKPSLLGLAVACICLAACAKTSQQDESMKTLQKFDHPIKASLAELDNALYLYTQFIAIGHDRWLASEATTVTTRIDLVPIKEGMSLEAVRMSLPKGRDLPQLSSAAAGAMQKGTFIDPEKRTLALVNGPEQIKDGYGGLAACLTGAPDCKFSAGMAFSPTDGGDLRDCAALRLSLVGSVHGNEVAIESAGGRCTSESAVKDLLQAAKLLAELEDKMPMGEIPLDTAEEAREVQRVAEMIGIQARIRGTRISLPGRQDEDAILLIAYARFGKRILGM